MPWMQPSKTKDRKKEISNIYKDDKGYKMTFTRDSMHEPLSIFRFKRGSLLGLEHIAKT